MYVYVVDYLGFRIAFKSVAEAEKYIEMMCSDSDRSVKPTITPCLLVGENDA